MKLEPYSMGIGDRFARQGKAQLQAMMQAKVAGVDVVPVWNKSHREHTIIGTSPADVRQEADNAVKALGWKRSYYVDADHIGLKNVYLFVESSDFFTLDVADFTGEAADADAVREEQQVAFSLLRYLRAPRIVLEAQRAVGRHIRVEPRRRMIAEASDRHPDVHFPARHDVSLSDLALHESSGRRSGRPASSLACTPPPLLHSHYGVQ